MLTYKRKLILNNEQKKRISSWIDTCRFVYNMALEIKIDAWRIAQKNIGSYELMNQLPTIKDISWINDVPAQCLQGVIERGDHAYKMFFKGNGYPKYKSKRFYNSILFKGVLKRRQNEIKLLKIGWLKMFKDARILGKIKTAVIKREIDGYFVYIVCDEMRTIQNTDESQVGAIDMGVVNLFVDHNGNYCKNPRQFKKYETKLRVENRSLSRKKKGSNRWKKQAKVVAMLHHKISNVRKDFLHKESTKLAKQYHTIYVEDLNIENMSKRCKPKQGEDGKFLPNRQARKSVLNNAILDAGWGYFRTMLSYKTNVVRVDQKYTSQTCNECGKKHAMSRVSQNKFVCVYCKHEANADENAAKNILSRGIALNRKREPLG
jgi:putative transposase